jgi:hypothetical protein
MRTRPRSLFTLATATALALTAYAAPAQAAPPDRHHVDPRPANEAIGPILADLAQRSHDRIAVRTIGETNEGRPVWAARVGHGPVRLQYVTQQHGDEPLGTPAAIEFLRTVGVGNTGWHKWLRSRVTVDVVVRANPDGHSRDWRYNDPTADPEFGERGKGYDLNRYHNPDLAPDDNPATEAAHVQRAYAAFRPHISVDYHMQGRYRDDDGREITASLLWPTHPDVRPALVDAAKQVSVVAQRTIDHLAGGNVSQYPGEDYEGIARNAYGLRGSASVLLELSAMGPAHEQRQIRGAYLVMLAVAQTAADGSVRHVDPARADAIPPRGDPISATPAATDAAD